GCFVGSITDGSVDALNHWHRLFTTICDLHLDQRISQPHRPQSSAASTQLGLFILLNEVIVGINHIVQEVHCDLAHLCKSPPIHLAVFYKCREIQGSEVT